MIENKIIKKIILDNRILSQQGIKGAIIQAKKENQNLLDYLFSRKIISEKIFYQYLANFYNVGFINLTNTFIKKDLLFLIPEPIAITHKIVCFGKDDKNKKIKIATLDPFDLQIFEFIKKKTGYDTIIFLTTPSSIKNVLKLYHKSLKANFEEIINPDKERRIAEMAQQLPIVRIVNSLLEYAIFENASDIHIEPLEKQTEVRYRIDGILKPVMNLPKSNHRAIVARIKILAHLKIDEHRLPQDGRFKIESPKYKVAFRVSIIPTFNGEKIVLRLLNEGAKVLSLEQLGLQKGAYEVIKRNIKKPHGMILVTGPTGSGKTTTLYTILNILNKPGVNISTIEDPVEYRIEHVNQSQINPKIGYTFAVGLRAFLRQDPDIIMVGEIRDKETAEIAVHAAMTGHLVLSTLHTNDAVTAVPRLVNLGVPAFLLASTLNIVIAQRLVRKICTNCIVSYNLDKDQIKELEKQLDFSSIMEVLSREKAIMSKNEPIEELLFYKGKGCKHCNFTGYKGRIGIYEVFENTEEMQNLIMKNASKNKLEKQAIKQGMMKTIEDGFIKAKNGITSIEEVMRVTEE